MKLNNSTITCSAIWTTGMTSQDQYTHRRAYIKLGQNSLEVFGCVEGCCVEMALELVEVQQNVPSVVVSIVSVGQCWPFHLCHILAELCDAGGLRELLFALPIGYLYGHLTFHSTDFPPTCTYVYTHICAIQSR